MLKNFLHVAVKAPSSINQPTPPSLCFYPKPLRIFLPCSYSVKISIALGSSDRVQ